MQQPPAALLLWSWCSCRHPRGPRLSSPRRPRFGRRELGLLSAPGGLGLGWHLSALFHGVPLAPSTPASGWAGNRQDGAVWSRVGVHGRFVLVSRGVHTQESARVQGKCARGCFCRGMLHVWGVPRGTGSVGTQGAQRRGEARGRITSGVGRRLGLCKGVCNCCTWKHTHGCTGGCPAAHAAPVQAPTGCQGAPVGGAFLPGSTDGCSASQQAEVGAFRPSCGQRAPPGGSPRASVPTGPPPSRGRPGAGGAERRARAPLNQPTKFYCPVKVAPKS